MKLVFITSAAIVLISFSSCGNKQHADNSSASTDSSATSVASVTEAAETPFPGYNTAGKDTIKLESGLQYIVLEDGEGSTPGTGAQVQVHYTGYLTDGTKFDSSVDRGKPLAFSLGTGMVIRGWDEGISKLRKGGKARLIVPQELGYGEAGFPPVIPSMATLIFDVELVDFQ